MKIDTNAIKGYADMSAEEKLAALEAFDMPDPDYSGYVKKDVFDKKASEAAEARRQLNAHLSDEEKKKAEQDAATKKLQEDYEKLLHETNVSKATAKFISLGYDEKLAAETAEAFVSGDTEKVFANQLKAKTALEKQLRAEILKDTPRGDDGGDPDDKGGEGSLGLKFAQDFNAMYKTTGEE